MSRRTRWVARLVPEMRRTLMNAAVAEADRIAGLAARARDLPAGLGGDEIAHQAEAQHLDLERVVEATRRAEMFWVTTPMWQVAMDASQDVPVLSAEHVPAPCGLMVFESALPEWDLAALGGLALRGEDRPDVEFTGPLHIDAMLWQRHPGGVRLWLCVKPDRLPLPLWGHQGKHLVPVADVQVTLPAALDGAVTMGPAGTDPEMVGILAFLSACWVLMMSPTTAERTTLDGRTGRPALADAPLPHVVSVVDLRPLRHVSVDHDEETGRRLSVRHLVRGHWRNQPHGKGRAERRLQWIDSYIKGPSGAPLYVSERVHVWRR